MEENQVNTLRESSRKVLTVHRRNHRNKINDIGRPLAEDQVNLSIKPEAVEEIANKLKTKSSITASELRVLQNGLLDDITNVDIVLNTHGALRGLVRELSGQDVTKQSLAAACCCNLALGAGRAGATVAKAAGPYLVALLDSLSADLAVTCAWALGNAGGAGRAGGGALAAQGAGARLAAALRRPELRDAALSALLLLATALADTLSSENVITILQALPPGRRCVTSSRLLFVLSCHKDFPRLDVAGTIVNSLLEDSVLSIRNHVTGCALRKSCCGLVYVIRTLANMPLSDELYASIVEHYLQSGTVDDFRIILATDSDVRDSLFWFLGNLYNYNSKHVFFNLLLK